MSESPGTRTSSPPPCRPRCHRWSPLPRLAETTPGGARYEKSSKDVASVDRCQPFGELDRRSPRIDDERGSDAVHQSVFPIRLCELDALSLEFLAEVFEVLHLEPH